MRSGMSEIMEAQIEHTEVLDDDPEKSEPSVSSASDKGNEINMQQSQSGSASASVDDSAEPLDQEEQL